MRFFELAHHAIWMVPTDKERIKRFIDGLTYQLWLHMTREMVSGANFDEVVNIARQIEMVYSHSLEEHAQHLRVVLQQLREEKLYAKLSRCEFWLSSVAFLWHVISGEGIQVDQKKIEAVHNWPRPFPSMEIRSFLGLASYYCRFVQGLSSIALPLTKLTQKGAPFK
ncbi:uncharacterized mitochondrial protein AtMg00860-like [Nicotiana sylvestris]|uniref:uncharacterized mitochondrial protein AtMg00860-like n=1 Tax=Nicotiana sylvestris TaxID=4096 RepID=UPI00388C7D59